MIDHPAAARIFIVFHCFSLFMDISRRFAHDLFYFHDICITSYIMDPFPLISMIWKFSLISRNFSSPASTGSTGSAYPVEDFFAGFHGMDDFCVSRGIFPRRLPRDGQVLHIPWKISLSASTESTGSAYPVEYSLAASTGWTVSAYPVDMYEGATSADARPRPADS